jgi:hypothetical protein
MNRIIAIALLITFSSAETHYDIPGLSHKIVGQLTGGSYVCFEYSISASNTFSVMFIPLSEMNVDPTKWIYWMPSPPGGVDHWTASTCWEAEGMEFPLLLMLKNPHVSYLHAYVNFTQTSGKSNDDRLDEVENNQLLITKALAKTFSLLGKGLDVAFANVTTGINKVQTRITSDDSRRTEHLDRIENLVITLVVSLFVTIAIYAITVCKRRRTHRASLIESEDDIDLAQV